MQYKDNTKIIIDKRKLDILVRLGCPDKNILELIKTGKVIKTGDKLIDDTLECLIDVRNFDNWGGKRKGAGRPRKNQDENQLEIQDENQVGNQDAIQVVDIDKDIYKYNLNNNNNLNKLIKKLVLKENQFLVDENFRIKKIPEYEIYQKEVGEEILQTVQEWLMEKKYGQVVDKNFICKQIVNFSKRNGLI